MAFPSVVNSNTTNSSGTASLALNMPASIVAGNLLLNISTAAVNDAGTTAMSGWTPITTAVQRSSGSGTIAVWGKIAVGGDTGTVTGTSAVRACITYQITSWSATLSDVTAALLAGAISALDPPALTPGFGALDYLWFAVARTNGTQQPTVPANYTNQVDSLNGTNRLACGQRNLNAASEDPGAFGGGVGNALAGTIAIKPIVNVALSRTATDSAGGSDTCARLVALPRTAADVATASDSASRGAGTRQGRSVTETFGSATDHATVARTAYLSTALIGETIRATDEAEDFTTRLPDPLIRLSGLAGDVDLVIALALDKLMSFPDAVPTTLTFQLPELVGITGNVHRRASVGESIGTADTVTSFADQKIYDYVDGSDAASFAYIRGVSDTAAGADALQGDFYPRPITESARASEDVTRTLISALSTSDVALGRSSCDDTATPCYPRDAVETLSVGDALDITVSFLLGASDDAEVVDGSGGVLVGARAATDAISGSDFADHL